MIALSNALAQLNEFHWVMIFIGLSLVLVSFILFFVPQD